MSPFMYAILYTHPTLAPHMRRMTVELVPDTKWFALLRDRNVRWGAIESVTILEILKLDLEEGMRVVLAEVVWKEGVPIQSTFLPGLVEVIATVRREGRKHTVIAKARVPPVWLDLMRRFDPDLMCEAIVLRPPARIITTVVGAEKELKRFLDVVSGFGKVKGVSFQAVSVHQRGVLGNLSRRQREVLLAAKRDGYYDYPRKVSTERLAQKMGIRKSTLIEHLRRAENRLIQEVLVEY